MRAELRVSGPGLAEMYKCRRVVNQDDAGCRRRGFLGGHSSGTLTGTGAAAEKCIAANRDFLGLNWKDPHFKNVLVRKAVSLPINRAQLISAVYSGYGKAATAGVSTAFNPTAGTSSFGYDPAQAKTLLAQAGYPHGFSFTLTYSPGYPGAYTDALATYIIYPYLDKASISC